MHSVLLLNTDYLPLEIIQIPRAIRLLYIDNVVEMVAQAKNPDGSLRFIRSARNEYAYPSILVLKKYVNRRKRKVRLNAKNLYLRDGYICQYTGQKLRPSDCSVDHIVPRCKGGWNDWDNLVTCHKKINEKKGDRTPEEAGIRLIKSPIKPSHYQFLIIKIMNNGSEEWKDYVSNLKLSSTP